MGDAGAALGAAGFRVLADVASEDDDVLHCRSPLLLGGTIPSDETRPRPSGDSCIVASGGGLTPKVRVGRAAALARQHGRKPRGLPEGNRTDLGDQSVGGIGTPVSPMETGPEQRPCWPQMRQGQTHRPGGAPATPRSPADLRPCFGGKRGFPRERDACRVVRTNCRIIVLTARGSIQSLAKRA